MVLAKAAGELARTQRRRGEFDAAERTLRAALERVRASGDGAALAEVHAGVASLVADRAFYGTMDPKEARKTLDEALATARRSGNRQALAASIDAAAWYDYAGVLFNGGSYDPSRRGFQEALAHYEAVGDLSGQAMNLFQIGLTYEQEGKKNEARAHYQRSAALAERADDPIALSYPIRHLGFFFAEEGNLDEALRYERRCAFLRIRGGLTRNVPHAYIAIGDLELQKGESGRARIYLTDALEIAREQHSDSGALDAHMFLGKVDERDNQRDSAVRHYQEALALAEKMKRNVDIKDACERLARVYEQLGDRSKAQLYRQRAAQAEQLIKAKG
ncbi:tetratricopeptide repeat protein [Pendulispora albinea]|uniref:Tetratricopeptide repeat protein n=1 Tax=Pendulispora albinea TaxID=2741071 RepID=A0ABZ2LW10_9BACT